MRRRHGVGEQVASESIAESWIVHRQLIASSKSAFRKHVLGFSPTRVGCCRGRGHRCRVSGPGAPNHVAINDPARYFPGTPPKPYCACGTTKLSDGSKYICPCVENFTVSKNRMSVPWSPSCVIEEVLSQPAQRSLANKMMFM